MTAIAHRPHPVTRAVSGVRDRLSDVAGIPVSSMDGAATATAIAEVHAAEAQLAELEGPAARARGTHRHRRQHRGVLDRELARRRHPHHPGAGTPHDAAR